MKRVIGLFFCSAIAMILSCTLFITAGQAQDDGKLNTESYWSTHNYPVFYGASEITFEAGALDEFNPQDPRFRVFARDFEDGDLTSHIELTRNTVNPALAGNYQLAYQVTDSHHNTTELIVPVIVTAAPEPIIPEPENPETPEVPETPEITDPEEADPPATLELDPEEEPTPAPDEDDDKEPDPDPTTDPAPVPDPTPDPTPVPDPEDPKEPSEPETHVSQIIVKRTVYTLPTMPNLTAAGLRQDNTDRQILGLALDDGESVDVCVTSGNLDLILWTEAGQNTTTVGSDCTTLTSNTFAIPLVSTPILNDGNLDHTFSLQLTYDDTLSALNYYHAGDIIATSDAEHYGIAESETIIAPVSASQLTDLETLSDALAYYQNAIAALDNLVGLELNPLNLSDQNVRVKALVSSDFFTSNHADSVRHLAQAYLGNFEKGDLISRDLAAELFTYYAMAGAGDPDRMILADVEAEYNSARQNGVVDTAARVYALANLLNHFEGAKTYARFAQAARAQSGIVASADFFLATLAESYGVNVLPYLDAWSQETDWDFQVSDAIKVKVMDKQYPLLSILADFVSVDSLSTFQSDLNLPLAYGLVAGSVLSTQNLTGTITLSVEIPDYDQLAGKVALIKNGKNTVRRIALDELSATNPTLELSELPVGTYALQMPVFSAYEQPLTYITVREQGNTTYSYAYTEVDVEPSDDLDNDVYSDLRTEILAKLNAYAQRVTEQELNDRSRNAAEKSALVREFNRLRAEDQTSYAGLIARIERGGLPAISYIGADAYANSSKIKFYELITATDAEDGAMDLNAENTKYRLGRIHPDRLTYYIHYQVTDSDGNTVAFKTDPIFISEIDSDDENNELPELPDDPNLPPYPNENPDDPVDNSNWLGGGNNSTTDPGHTSDPADPRPTTPTNPSETPSQDSPSPSDSSITSPSLGVNDTADAGISSSIINYNPSGNYYVPSSNGAVSDDELSALAPGLSDPGSASDNLVVGPTATKPSTQTPTTHPSSSSQTDPDFFAQASTFFGELWDKISSNPIMLISAISAVVAVVLLFVAAKKYITLRAEAAYRPEHEIKFEDPVF